MDGRKASELAQQPGCLGALVRFWRGSYGGDYSILIFLVFAWVMLHLFVHPFYQLFSLDNSSIQYPFAVVERVPVLWSIIYSGIFPLLAIGIWCVLFRPGSHFVHVTLLGLLASLLVTIFITDIIKNAVGRPRPDLISRCKPEKGTPEHTLVDHTVCTSTNSHILNEGWRSFPSGHSSFAFSGLGYLSFFLTGQLRAWRPRSGLARLLVSLSPLLGALMIAISRIADYRHDVYDVCSGSIIGLGTAYLVYRCYYPSLWSADCDTPYHPDDQGMHGFQQVGDEEQAFQPEQVYNEQAYHMQPLGNGR
ncbi:diacylglycerol pyrophosphate phosphatase [Trichophyton mentagrophytes]|nr:diacylglycerol pyrophosphate phosphatase [Trichophyton mentagrophytes]